MPSSPQSRLRPLNDKPGTATRSPPSPKQMELIKSWSGAARNGRPGSGSQEAMTPKTSPRAESEVCYSLKGLTHKVVV